MLIQRHANGMEGLGSFLKSAAKKTMGVMKYALPVWYVGAYATDKLLGTGVTSSAPPPPPPDQLIVPPPPPPPGSSSPAYNGVQPIQAGQYLIPPEALSTPAMTVPASGTSSWLVPAVAAGGALVLVLILTSKKKPA